MRPRLTLVQAPAVPERPPLISSAAQRTEAEGKRFYPRCHLKPSELPDTYRPTVSASRWSWRVPAAVALGAFVGLAALGLHCGLVTSCALGCAAALAVRLMDGWARS